MSRGERSRAPGSRVGDGIARLACARGLHVLAVAMFAGAAAARAQDSPSTQTAQVWRTLWSVPLKSASYGCAAAADIDQDGKPEIVFGTYYNDEHVYALNGEDGSILWRFKSRGGPVDTSVLIHDVNDDGKPEVLFGDSAYGVLFCLNGEGQVVWAFEGQSGADSPAAAADLDGDGATEAVYGTMRGREKTGFVNVLRGKDGTVRWSAAVPGHVQCEPALVDLNGDNVLDVLVTNWMGDNQLRALNGKDGSALWQFATDDWVYHGVSAADFDADGEPEIVIADRKGHVWLLHGDSGRVKWRARLEDERDGSVFGPTSLVDVDRDGTPEIVVPGVHLHLLDAQGKLRWRREYGGRSIARGAAVADADGDGVPDLVFGAGTRLCIVRGDTGVETAAVDLRTGSDPFEDIDHQPLLLDLDGDGFLDIFVVVGRGLSGEEQPKNYGRAVALTGGKGCVLAGIWTTFRGGPRRLGMATTSRQPTP